MPQNHNTLSTSLINQRNNVVGNHASTRLQEEVGAAWDKDTAKIFDIDGVITQLSADSANRTLSNNILPFLKGAGKSILFNTNGVIGGEDTGKQVVPKSDKGFIKMVQRALPEDEKANWQDYMPNILTGSNLFYDNNTHSLQSLVLGEEGCDELKALNNAIQKKWEDFAEEHRYNKAIEVTLDWGVPSFMGAAVEGENIPEAQYNQLLTDMHSLIESTISKSDILKNIFKTHHVPGDKGKNGDEDLLILKGSDGNKYTQDVQATLKSGKAFGVLLLLDKVAGGGVIEQSDYEIADLVAMDREQLIEAGKNIFEKTEFPTIVSAFDTFSHKENPETKSLELKGSDADMVKALTDIVGRDKLLLIQINSMGDPQVGYERPPYLKIDGNNALTEPSAAHDSPYAPNLIFPSVEKFTDFLAGIERSRSQSQETTQAPPRP